MYQIEQQETEKAQSQGLPVPTVTMVFKEVRDERRYNEPRHDEVSAVFVGEDGAPPPTRDIIVYPKDEPLQRISYMNSNLDPMVYPLLFPCGESGWTDRMQHVDARRTAVRTTCLQSDQHFQLFTNQANFFSCT